MDAQIQSECPATSESYFDGSEKLPVLLCSRRATVRDIYEEVRGGGERESPSHSSLFLWSTLSISFHQARATFASSAGCKNQMAALSFHLSFFLFRFLSLFWLFFFPWSALVPSGIGEGSKIKAQHICVSPCGVFSFVVGPVGRLAR